MTTARDRWAVVPPEAAAKLVTSFPAELDAMERHAREMLRRGGNARVADALAMFVEQVRASGRDFLASLEDTAINQLASTEREQPVAPVPSSVSVAEAAHRLHVGVRMIAKLVAEGKLTRVSRGRICAVSLALELKRRGIADDGPSSEAS